MKRYTLFLMLLFNLFHAIAQPSDFIILQKKGKTIQSFYAGTQIEFVTRSGAYRSALIKRVHHDSLFIQEFLIQQMVTQFGFYVIDTVGSFRYAYHYKDIKSIGKPQKGFNVSGSGAALMGGGILLTLASGVVFIADRKKFSPPLLVASVALGGLGYLLNKAGSKGIVIGKKNYSLEYMKMTTE